MSFSILVFLPFILVLILLPYWISIIEIKQERNEDEINNNEYTDQSVNEMNNEMN